MAIAQMRLAAASLLTLSWVATAAATEPEWLQVDDPASGAVMRAAVIEPPAQALQAPWHVIVMLHGLGGDSSAWTERSGAVEALHVAMSSHALPPSLIVLPEGGDGYWSESFDGARPHRRLLLALLDAVGRRYPVQGSPASTAIVGASMGGFGALSLALQHPERFGIAIALSATDLELAVAAEPRRSVYLAVLGDPPSRRVLEAINPLHLVRAGAGRGQRFLLAWGGKEPDKFRVGGERLRAAMAAAQLSVQTRTLRDGRHGWASTWRPLQSWWLAGLAATWSAPAAAKAQATPMKPAANGASAGDAP